MQRLPLVIAALFSLLLLPAARAADWKPAAGPLMTRWAKDVSPENALPEYPRPQMVRKDWLNLNGLWDIKLADGTQVQDPRALPRRIGLVGRDEARRPHDLSPPLRRSRRAGTAGTCLLHFGAVDWEAKVSVNGKKLGVHRGGYDDFSFDITDALKTSGEQEIVGRGLRPHRCRQSAPRQAGAASGRHHVHADLRHLANGVARAGGRDARRIVAARAGRGCRLPAIDGGRHGHGRGGRDRRRPGRSAQVSGAAGSRTQARHSRRPSSGRPTRRICTISASR